MLSILKENALNELELLSKVMDDTRAINEKIGQYCKSDFDEYKITCIHPDLLHGYVSLLDLILGDEIASYYLYEVKMMSKGGSITHKGKTHKIRNMADVRKYVEYISKKPTTAKQ